MLIAVNIKRAIKGKANEPWSFAFLPSAKVIAYYKNQTFLYIEIFSRPITSAYLLYDIMFLRKLRRDDSHNNT